MLTWVFYLHGKHGFAGASAYQLKSALRRKMARRASMQVNMMKDIDIVSTLADYIDVGTDRIRCYIARALVTFLNETTALNAREMDTFIANNCHYLTRW